jgi:hypothetical protein
VFGKSSHHPTASLPQHGFARTNVWRVTAEGENSVTFTLNDNDLSPDVKKLWDYEFSMDYTVEVNESELKTTLQVRNPGTEPWECNTLLHTYLRVPVLPSLEYFSCRMFPKWESKDYPVSNTKIKFSKRYISIPISDFDLVGHSRRLRTCQNHRRNGSSLRIYTPFNNHSSGHQTPFHNAPRKLQGCRCMESVHRRRRCNA